MIQIAAHPTMDDRIVLAAVEQGAELANGLESPMDLVSFFIQDADFGHLNEIGLLLFRIRGGKDLRVFFTKNTIPLL